MVIAGTNTDDLPKTFGYNADNTLAYVQVVVPPIPGAYAGKQ